jgi:hypothetical protein
MNLNQIKYPFVFGQNCLDNNLLQPDIITNINNSEFLIDNISLHNSNNSKSENISVIKELLNSNNLFENESLFSLNNSIEENSLSEINLLNNSTININYSFPYEDYLIKESYLKIQPCYPKTEIFESLSQINKSNCQNDLSKSNIFIKNKIYFEIKHRGRKGIKLLNNKTHRKSDFDNILAKIQVHFINFIINLSNDALKIIKGNNFRKTFKNINYDFKKKINIDYIKKLQSYSIKDILIIDISSKYTTLPKNFNEKLINEVCNSSNWLEEFFNMKYISLFKYYYNNEKTINGKEIIFSSKTKSFKDLLEKKKNEDIKDLIVDAVKSAYFNGYNSLNKTFYCKK